MEPPPLEPQVLIACNTLNGSLAGSVGSAAALATYMYILLCKAMNCNAKFVLTSDTCMYSA